MPKRKLSLSAITGSLKTAATNSFPRRSPPTIAPQQQDINDRLRTFRHEAGEGGLFNGGAFAPGNDKL